MSIAPPGKHDASALQGELPRAGLSTATLDRWYPPCGPCAGCGFHDARHRVWDTWMEQAALGATAADIAADFDEPVEHVEAVLTLRPYKTDVKG